MATDESNRNHQPRHLSQPELIAPGDRMLARAISTLFDLRPELRSDMLLCVGCLRLLAQTNRDGVEIHVWSEYMPR
jgi:hypothetical protein